MSVKSHERLTFTLGKCRDLTAPITPDTVVFPGDPRFSSRAVATIGAQSLCGLSEMKMGNHLGTHIDFPAHVFPQGKTSSDYSLQHLMGHGIILEVPIEFSSIGKNFVSQQPILQNDFVFFKTSNSGINKQGGFCEKYVYIEPDAVDALLEKKVRVVGIDYISVDALHAEELPVHKALLERDILIVENLELQGVDPGRCFLFVMPLNVPGMDGLPARVLMMSAVD
ncbi:MAG: cyclase family protein [Pseudomonadota bacterium]